MVPAENLACQLQPSNWYLRTLGNAQPTAPSSILARARIAEARDSHQADTTDRSGSARHDRCSVQCHLQASTASRRQVD